MTIIRPAFAHEQVCIRALVRAERMNPTGLDWPNFLVAVDQRGVVGAVQMRKHPDGSRELGSLVVIRSARGQGIASRLIDALLADEDGPVFMITDGAHSAHYAQWGFRRIAPLRASPCIRRNYVIGRLAIILSILKGLPRRRLVVLERPGEVRLAGRSARAMIAATALAAAGR